MARDEAARMVGASRRRISRHLFSVPSLLLLLLLCCACGPAYGWNRAWDDGVPLFAPLKTKVPKKADSEEPTNNFSSFYSPFVVGGNGVMLVLAEARYNESDEGKKNVDIVARYVETEGTNWAGETPAQDGANWETQLAMPREDEANHFALRNPIAVMKGIKTYLLALSNRGPDGPITPDLWHVELSVGEIVGESGSKRIQWNASGSPSSQLSQEIKNKKLSVFPGHRHSALLTMDDTIVFSVNATNEEGEPGFAIMQLYDGEHEWEVSFVPNPGECRLFSLFEWKTELFGIFSGCLRGNRYVKEYNEVREKWEDVAEPLFYGWGSKHPSRDFTPVTIGNKKVLLFTKGCSSQNSIDGCVLPLFFTDGIRMGQAGWIHSSYVNVNSGGLVYTNGELFFMYQGTGEVSGAIVFKRLSSQLSKIESALKTWGEVSAYLSKPCNETASEEASSDTLCVTPMPTDGLVGFLWNESKDGAQWWDDYGFTSALVNNSTRVLNGYKFKGAGAGAQWSVLRSTFSEWYNFTEYGLTIVATVTIHETPENNAPLLTVGGVGSDERLGLWYKNGRWKLVSTNGKKGPAVDFEIQKEYRVALILHNNTISVYFDGESQGSPLPISASEDGPFNPENVVIGGYGRKNSIHVTVTSVLLYNRVLNDTELEAASQRVPLATSTNLEETPEATTGPNETPEATTGPNETPEATTGPNETPEATAGPNETLETTAGLKKTPETPTNFEKTRETPTGSNETLEATTGSKETPEATTGSNETLETPGSNETPEATTGSNETLEATTGSKETLETPGSNETLETPGPKETPEATTGSNETLETPTGSEETPKTPTGSEETPKTPTDPKGDSSEHVRMGASLLFLLGLRALVLLFSTSI